MLAILGTLALAGPDTAGAQERSDIAETIVVDAELPPSGAAGTQLDHTEVATLPGRSADSVLRGVRGLHMSAHGGRGKAFQYFLRGFDAVHGADIAVDLEGVPLNEPSNVHGHGYLDLHFIPRQLIDGARFEPGPVDASVGDFGIAGAGSLSLGMARTGLQVQLTGGSDRGGALALGYRPRRAPAGTFLWADVDAGQGIGDARGWRQSRVGGGVEATLGPVDIRVFGLGYSGRFESPGVVRAVDVEDGEIDFYGAYPGSGGGESQRVLLGARVEASEGAVRHDTTLWTSMRRLSLEQNYTGFYENPELGDGSVQTHDAVSFGGRTQVDGAFDDALRWRLGADARVDRFTQTEATPPSTQQPDALQLDVSGTQIGLGAFGETTWSPRSWLRVVPGMRFQYMNTEVDRRRELGINTGKVSASAPFVAPRGRIELAPEGSWSGYLRGARGLRSSEARGLESGRAPVASADSVEASMRLRQPAGSVRLGGFGTWVSNEIVFDHTAARFETAGRTRRLGLFGGATVRPVDGVSLEVDVTASDGRYAESGLPLPYAPRVLVVSQARTEAVVTGPLVWNAGIRTWWMSSRPLPGGFASSAPCVTDLTIQANHRGWSFDMDIDNVFATKWRDGEFQYASDWSPGDGEVSALSQRHFTAGAPFTVRFGVGWRMR